MYGWRIYLVFFFFQAEDGIRGLVRSRGLGDVFKRQVLFASGFYLSIRRKLHTTRWYLHLAFWSLPLPWLSLIHI